jgi:hypothetical protein
MDVSKVMRLENPCENPLVPAHKDFKKIIVQLMLPNPKAKNVQPFPSSLLRENISPEVERVMRKNFAACLKGKTVVEPAVVVAERRIAQMMDPDNLVYLIQVNYPEYTGLNRDGARYALLSATVFRAEMNSEATIFNAYYTRASIIDPEIPLPSQLEFALRLVRPDQFRGVPF